MAPVVLPYLSSSVSIPIGVKVSPFPVLKLYLPQQGDLESNISSGSVITHLFFKGISWFKYTQRHKFEMVKSRSLTWNAVGFPFFYISFKVRAYFVCIKCSKWVTDVHIQFNLLDPMII